MPSYSRPDGEHLNANQHRRCQKAGITLGNRIPISDPAPEDQAPHNEKEAE